MNKKGSINFAKIIKYFQNKAEYSFKLMIAVLKLED